MSEALTRERVESELSHDHLTGDRPICQKCLFLAHDAALRERAEKVEAHAKELYEEQLDAAKRFKEEIDAETMRADKAKADLAACRRNNSNATRLLNAKDAEIAALRERAENCENGHRKHEDCTEACSCVGLGKSKIEQAEARTEKAEAERDCARGEAAASAVLLDQAREDVERLREAIEKAPHREECVRAYVDNRLFRCDCWKAAALTEGEEKK